jgi:hypothetical protein
LRGLIQHLKEASRQILSGREPSTAFGASNFAGFVDALDVIENLLVTPLFAGVAVEETGVEGTAQFFQFGQISRQCKAGSHNGIGSD